MDLKVIIIIAVSYLYGFFELFMNLRQRRKGKIVSSSDKNSLWWLYGSITVGYILSFTIGASKIGRIYEWNTLFVIGMVLFGIGLIIRIKSIVTLNEFFTYSVTKTINQTIIKTGPYKLIRHPGYLGQLIIFLGISTSISNWLSVLAMIFPITFGYLYRIYVEEKFLIEQFGEDYLSNGVGINFPVELDSLGIIAENAVLNVTLEYKGIVITEMSHEIKVVSPENASEENETEPEEVIILNITEMNLTIANETVLNITSNLSLIEEIESIRIQKNENVSINLADYFAGAESYESRHINNISTLIEDQIITFIPEQDFVGARKGIVTAILGEEVLESNEFNILVSSGAVRIKTSKGNITLGKKVKWTTNISLDIPENITIEIPASAENITVTKLEETQEGGGSTNAEFSTSPGITGDVIVEVKIKKKSLLLLWFQEISRILTGNVVIDTEILNNSPEENEVIEVIIDDNATEYIVEYYT
ncbi:MAG: isoprenylcysteine carboxylmethyltransferase family protein, partial [Ignavibacteria bacterium]|nr:isoprenylcysteine carboxylmethyltransferase family protein [Ignavibacteria bacterium]